MKGSIAVGLPAFLILAFPTFAATAQPPRPGCTAVDKREYDAARRRYLLHTRNGEYLRTGRVLRRQYWYCQ